MQMYSNNPLVQCTKNGLNKDTYSCYVHLSNEHEMGKTIFRFDPSRDKEYNGAERLLIIVR